MSPEFIPSYVLLHVGFTLLQTVYASVTILAQVASEGNAAFVAGKRYRNEHLGDIHFLD